MGRDEAENLPFCYLLLSLQVLTLILTLVLRFGGYSGYGVFWDGMFLSIGTTVGFCLIVTATIIGHAVGDLQISMLELTSDVMAVVLFCAVGIIGVAHSKLSQMIIN